MWRRERGVGNPKRRREALYWGRFGPRIMGENVQIFKASLILTNVK